jgi:hypothetical protein
MRIMWDGFTRISCGGNRKIATHHKNFSGIQADQGLDSEMWEGKLETKLQISYGVLMFELY